MKRNVDIGSYLPPITGEKREFKAIAETESQELTAVWTDTDAVHQNQYLFDSDEYGVKRREKMLKILPLAGDTLDTRKFRIYTLLNNSLPYTIRVLEERLRQLCGEKMYTLDLYPAAYTLVVRVGLDVQSKYEAVKELLEKMMPNNLVLDINLMYNPHKYLAQFAHRQLSMYTHKELREKRLWYNKQSYVKGFTHAQLAAFKHYQMMMEEL